MTDGKRAILWIGILTAVVIGGGCQKGRTSRSRQEKPEMLRALGDTVQDRAMVAIPRAMPVEGYGLVGGLAGTGTTECPETIKAYLMQFVRSEVSNRRVEVERLVASPNTAVVYLKGLVPMGARVGDRFDLHVQAIVPQASTSLAGGWLYSSELSPEGVGIGTQQVAKVQGGTSVFIDRLTETPTLGVGYIFHAAHVIRVPEIVVVLDEPDFQGASVIRNRINNRFGVQVAVASSERQVTLKIPTRYQQQRMRYYGLVESLFLDDSPVFTGQRLNVLQAGLLTDPNPDLFALHLEAVGQESLTVLEGALPKSQGPARLATARSLLNLGQADGFRVLMELARSGDTATKRAAVEAMAEAGGGLDVVPALKTLLNHEDWELALLAYQKIVILNPGALVAHEIEGVVAVDAVHDCPHQVIWAARQGQPRIVLFGSPMLCQAGHRLDFQGGAVTIDTTVGQEHTVLGGRSSQGHGIGPVMASRSLAHIIQVVFKPALKKNRGQGGLGLPYDQLLALLREMKAIGMIEAEVQFGPLPEVVQ